VAFTHSVKDEILRQPEFEKCCLNAFIAAVLRISGTVAHTPDAFLRINSENALLTRKIYSILKDHFNLSPHILSAKSLRLKKHSEFGILVGRLEDTRSLLESAGIRFDESGLPEYRPYFTAGSGKPCCRRAYLTGAFLASGSMNEPEKAYHCEVSTHSSLLSDEISRIMNAYGLNSRVIVRKNSYVVYIKEAEGISDFMRVIHAHKSLIEYENIRIVKDMRNNINRMVNCETANISKTVSSSYKQAEDIEYIIRTMGVNALPEALLQVAEARLTNREASLKELGEMLDPKLSRSGVNHRLNRIAGMAGSLRDRTLQNGTTKGE
jgi:DNA-binding protein WhiA